jgi:mannose-6-phosphate isomerase
MHRLQNRIQEYAWGSRTAIAELLGLPSPSRMPQAEMWMGAHPVAPSSVVREGHALSLLRLIEENPPEQLGEELAARYGGQLPFLLKVLAAEAPLSLQVHPSLAQAQEGFAREDARGVARDAPHRNYRDPNHKPELLCALTPMQALCGFRTPEETLEIARELGVPALLEALQPLAERPGTDGLRAAFASLLELPLEQKARLLEEVLAACAVHAVGTGSVAEAAACVLRLSEHHPGDVGAVVSLLLNLVTLEPGEALYLDAGILHAYVQGTGIEVMANSDNVLRCGLTPKHVDVDELLRVLDFRTGPVERLRAEPCLQDPGEDIFRTSAPDFRLSRVQVGDAPVHLQRRGPEVVLCVEGSIELEQEGKVLSLSRGESAFVPASDPNYRVVGRGVFFRATVG